MGRRTALWLCAALLGGCFDLTEVADADPEPAFLGDLSGLYDLWIMPFRDEEGLDAEPALPLGARMRILHLKEADQTAESLFAIEQLVQQFDDPFGGIGPDGQGTQPAVARLIDAEVTGNEIVGELSFLGQTVPPTDVVGRTLAGGNVISFQAVHGVCPGGERYSLVGRMVCPVNPALSGVYASTGSDCDGADARYFALGFYDDGFLGHAFPGDDLLLEGSYSHQTETGIGYSTILMPDGADVDGPKLLFDLEEVETELLLTGKFFAGPTPPEEDEFIHGDCTPGCSDPDCESFELARLIGGDAQDCSEASAPPEASAFWWYRTLNEGQRVLVVETLYSDITFDGTGAPEVFTEVFLRRADQPEVVLAQAEPSASSGEVCDPLPCACAWPECFACECDQNPGCDGGCVCDWECPCPCGEGDGFCSDETCSCDPDCFYACPCNYDETCEATCVCDPDCCDCYHPENVMGPQMGVSIELPAVPAGETIEYELFVWVFEPGSSFPTAAVPQCLSDDGEIDDYGFGFE